MKFTHIFILALLAAVVAVVTGCQKTESGGGSATVTNNVEFIDQVPTEAQPKLPTVKIYLGPETLDAEMAITRHEMETGLMFRTNITDETAMLFDMHFPQPVSFWMTNCPMSLSCAYIGPDGVIEEIHHLEKNDSTPVLSSNKDILYVLEVNDGWFTRHNIAPGTLIRSERGSLAETFGQ